MTEEAERIAVLPFSASGPGVEVLGEGMVDLLTTNLQGVGGIQAVDPRLVLKRWGRKDPDEESGVQEALDLGRELDAGSVVTGSAVSAGGRVRLAADLYAVAGGERLGRAQVDGPADSILPLVDRLSVALLRDVWRSREPLPSLDLGSLTTDSIAALRAYLQGERYYRRFALDSALAQYTRAVEVDSTFALAHLRRALVFGWTGGYGSPASVQAAEAGFRYAERLPPRSRRLLAGYQAFQEGSSRAIDSMRAYVNDYPADLEGWYFYGEALHHLVEIEPRSPDTVLAAFDRVIAGDSTSTPGGGASARDHDDLPGQRPVRPLSPAVRPDRAPRAAVAPTAWRRSWSGDRRLRRAISASRSLAVPHLAFYAVVAAYRDESATSDSILDLRRRLFAALPPAPRCTASSRWTVASCSMGLGRLREARALVDTVAAISPGAAAGLLGWPVALGLAPSSSADDQGGLAAGAGQARQDKPADGGLRGRHPGRGAGRTEEAVKRATEAIQAPNVDRGLDEISRTAARGDRLGPAGPGRHRDRDLRPAHRSVGDRRSSGRRERFPALPARPRTVGGSAHPCGRDHPPAVRLQRNRRSPAPAHLPGAWDVPTRPPTSPTRPRSPTVASSGSGTRPTPSSRAVSPKPGKRSRVSPRNRADR